MPKKRRRTLVPYLEPYEQWLREEQCRRLERELHRARMTASRCCFEDGLSMAFCQRSRAAVRCCEHNKNTCLNNILDT
jgi:hypothetical protein